MRLLILGALVAVAAAGIYSPGYSSLSYAAPRIEYPVAPLPAPVYHTPAVQFSSSYRQDTFHAAPRAFEYATAYAPAPVFKAAPIHAPISNVVSGYSYQTAPLLKTYASHAPLLQGYPSAPHGSYGLPHY